MEERYFLYDPAGDEWAWFATQEECLAAAKALIALYADDGEWNEDVEEVIMGEVTHIARQTNRKDRPPDEELVEGEDKDGIYWPDNGADYICDYEMLPVDKHEARQP